MAFNWFKRRPGSARVPSADPAEAVTGKAGTAAAAMRQLGVQLNARHDGNGTLALSIVPPDAGAPPKLDICIVIDTSGSMAEAANPNGAEEAKLFSKMDLAKRGAEVIARSLGADDTLTLLGFESRVVRWMKRTHMDAAGLGNALERLAQLRPGGGTALWDGLCAGLQALEVEVTEEEANRLAVVILLTDGQPCPSPPEGEVAELTKYLASHAASAEADKPLRACKLVTMGFGYDVNSKLLLELATTHGRGMGNDLAFIPDGTMLLTNFVNLCANLKSTCMRRAVLRITPPAAGGPSEPPPVTDVAQAMDAAFTTGAATATAAATPPSPINLPSLVSVQGEVAWRPLPLPDGSVGLEVLLGDVLYGCPRNVVLREQRAGAAAAAAWGGWCAEVAYEPLVPGNAGKVVWPSEQPAQDTPLVTRQLHRALAVSAIHHAARVATVDLPGAQKAVKDCALATMALQGGPLLQGLEPHPIMEDLLGQVSEAVGSPDAWSKWGSHYLRSLLSAHKAEACNNFKDPGVLAYGSAYSRRCREELNTMCDSLPVPTPSIRPRGTALGQPVSVSAASFTRAFNNQHGGCFAAGSRVLMADGCLKPIEQLRKGDLVSSQGGAPAPVACVVKHSGTQAVRLPGSGLCITPWHPVRVEGRWRFPIDLATEALAAAPSASEAAALASSCACTPSAVYNLVLGSGHTVMVEGVEAVTLGHGFQEDVVRHPFYGTSAVLGCLRACPGWGQGLVDLGEAAWQLDPSTGLVSGLSTPSANPCISTHSGANAVACA